MSSTRKEVRVVRVTDSEAIKVADRFWVMRANYHLVDGSVVSFTGGMHQRKKDAVASGARLEAEVGNTMAIWYEDTPNPTFVSSQFKMGTGPDGRFAMVPNWDDDEDLSGRAAVAAAKAAALV